MPASPPPSSGGSSTVMAAESRTLAEYLTSPCSLVSALNTTSSVDAFHQSPQSYLPMLFYRPLRHLSLRASIKQFTLPSATLMKKY